MASKTKEIQKKPSAAAGALAKVDYGEFAGAGFEGQTSQDMAIPFLGLLQQMSPQLQKGDPAHIPGAEAGDLFNTVTGELLASPVLFVPCCTEHVFVEWVPRDAGGGFVGVHALNSPDVAAARQTADSFNKLKAANGNDLVETFYIYGLLLEDVDAVESASPIVLAFTSTKIKVYKRLMTRLRTVRGNPPLFAHRLAVSSVGEKNKRGQPYHNLRIESAKGSLPESMILPDGENANLLAEGAALVKAVRSGVARASHESQEKVAEAGEDTVF